MISILCPTRNRPVRFAEMCASARNNAVGPIEILAYQAIDDISVLAGADRVYRGERIPNSDTWNVLAGYAVGDIFMLCGDDVVFRTAGWDKIVEDHFVSIPDRISYAFGNDGSETGTTFGPHGFIHRNWYNAIGYFGARGYICDFIDKWLMDVAGMVGRCNYVDVLIEHLHPVWNKADQDDTYRDAQHVREDNSQWPKWESELPLRQRDAAALRTVMQS